MARTEMHMQGNGVGRREAGSNKPTKTGKAAS